MKKFSLGLFILSLFVISTLSAANANQSDSAAPTPAELEHSTFNGIGDTPVTLLNGKWEGDPYVEGGASRPRVGLVNNSYLADDLDGDGVQEAIVILWQSSAGTGENTYIAVMARQNGEIRNIDTALIGDRVKIRSSKIDNGKITLEVLQVGESDAMCCPTMLAERTWSLQGNLLEEDEMEVTGKLSLAVLEGTEWELTHMDRKEPLAKDAEVTLAFVNGRVAGKSACNRYSAAVVEGESPGEIKISRAMSTMMACPGDLMKIERQYLDALSQVTGFSFHIGSLALNGQTEDGTAFTMLYSKKE